MKALVCRCRAFLNTAHRARRTPPPAYRSASTKPPPDEPPQSATLTPDFVSLLSKPTWSVRSLLPPQAQKPGSGDDATQGPTAHDGTETITPAELSHLLRLSALPPPATPAEEADMIATLRSQLHFVRAIRAVDTTGVPPLSAIRDETREGRTEATISLDRLRDALDAERKIGPYARPWRDRTRETEAVHEIDGGWDPLATAPTTAGRYLVVKTGGRME